MFKSVFSEDGNWYKGNLHMHTTRSDGRADPAAALSAYRRSGYDFVAITDHRKPGITIEPGCTGVLDGTALSPENMLLLSGVEWDTGGTNSDLPGDCPCWHILGIGMTSSGKDADFAAIRHPSPQQIVDIIRQDGGLAILAHPCWSVMDPASLTGVTGFAAAEIYNAISENPWNGNRADSSIWFDLWASNQRICMPAVAGDDAHSYDGDQCQSFTMVRAASLTRDGIMDAIRRGDFYASRGPVIKDIALDRENHLLRIDCSADVVAAAFYSNSIWQENRVMSVLHKGTVTYPIAREETYIRAELMDRFGRKAWTSPIPLREA